MRPSAGVTTRASPQSRPQRSNRSQCPSLITVLERDGVIALVGADHIHGNIHRAVQAERDAAERGRDDAG